MFRDYIVLFAGLTALVLASYLVHRLWRWHRWLVLRILLALLASCGLYRSVVWALRPMFTIMEVFGDPTPLEYARNNFGPLLLQKHGLEESSWTWGKRFGAWADFEVVYRLVAIITVLWVLCCILFVIRKRRTAQRTRHSIGRSAA
jgi:hypothetical protein